VEVDAELAPGDSFEAPVSEVSFAQLHATINDTDVPWLLKKWLLGRVVLAESLYEKGNEGNVQAAKMILRSVVFTAERQSGKKINEDGAKEIARLAQALLGSL
jgi:ribose 1,5-bisphosphokinase PhnN